MYKFHPILKSVIWGGERIVPYKQMISEVHDVGESWEISSIHGNLSVVSDGPDKGLTIVELIDKYRDRLVGKDNYLRHGNTFPLLVKFIDAHQDLSVQVHPSDGLAMQRHGCNGKTEMWYVVEADENARLCSGLAHGINKHEYIHRVESGSIEAVLHYENVKVGDVFFLPAGRVHSLGAGCLVAEIQQSSDITYRIYDYNRKDKDGKQRELHIDLSKDAIDYDAPSVYKTHYKSRLNEPVSLVSCPYFTTSLYELTESMECDYSELDSFLIYVCVAGAAQLMDSVGHVLHVHEGESVLVPAYTDSVIIMPESSVKLLEVFV